MPYHRTKGVSKTPTRSRGRGRGRGRGVFFFSFFFRDLFGKRFLLVENVSVVIQRKMFLNKLSKNGTVHLT